MAEVEVHAHPACLQPAAQDTFPYRHLLTDLLYALSGYCGDVFVNGCGSEGARAPMGSCPSCSRASRPRLPRGTGQRIACSIEDRRETAAAWLPLCRQPEADQVSDLLLPNSGFSAATLVAPDQCYVALSPEVTCVTSIQR
jgi:hypothetical protein